jgi:hypothetical protein
MGQNNTRHLANPFKNIKKEIKQITHEEKKDFFSNLFLDYMRFVSEIKKIKLKKNKQKIWNKFKKNQQQQQHPNVQIHFYY